jgi:hypothetical protein
MDLAVAAVALAVVLTLTLVDQLTTTITGNEEVATEEMV